MNKLATISFLALVLMGFANRNPLDLIYPKHFPKPVYDFSKNPLTEEKIELGRALFYDPILSKDNSISCASCHSPYNAFAHTDHDLSHGINDEIGTRNAPALFNLAWSSSFMWDGAIHHLDMQALAPIEHAAEMGESFANVVDKLNRSNLYPRLFQDAFQDSVATGEHFLKAIAQFQLSLVSANSKYDKVKRGEDAFSIQEQMGYDLFVEHCSSCHAEPLFTNGEFANNGLSVDTSLNDQGRMTITNEEKDLRKFKVPSLRNIEYSYPYMHDGRFERISEVVNHYVKGITQSETLDTILKDGVKLESNERVDLVSFLLTLSDKDFVFDAKHQFPRHLLLDNETKN